jgi:hypothetical protein
MEAAGIEPATLVATVRVFVDPSTDRLKRQRDVELIPVTRGDRDELPVRLA